MKPQPASIRPAPLTGVYLKSLLMIVTGSTAIAISAQISVPMFPVPMTLQTLVITLIGLTFGSRLAALAVLAYLAEGALGLPVFANGGAGLAKLIGPTSGFLWGFVGMAFLTGYLRELGFSTGIGKLFVAAAIPAALLYVPGALALWSLSPLDLSKTVQIAVVPFLPGDLLKSTLAVFLVAGSRKLLMR